MLEEHKAFSRIALICYNNATAFDQNHLQSWKKLASFFEQAGKESAQQKCLQQITWIAKKLTKKERRN